MSKILCQGSCCIIKVCDQNSKYFYNKPQKFSTMEGCSTTKPRDQHSRTNEDPDVSTPNETKTPQQTPMVNVTSSCNENQTFSQMKDVPLCNENQTHQQNPVTNGVSCPPWVLDIEST